MADDAPRGRPRNYLNLDLHYGEQDTVEELRDNFGPAGPLVFLYVILEAHKQARADRKKNQGTAEFRYGAMARTAGCGADVVKAVVAMCVELELLAVLEQSASRCTIALLKWDRWEARDVGAAERKRRSREAN